MIDLPHCGPTGAAKPDLAKNESCSVADESFPDVLF